MRPDLEIISQWIREDTRVLDLGCGDGTLLKHLQDTTRVFGYGLEIDHHNIISCLEKGINVIQADLDAGLSQFDDNSFDYVVMTQTLQAIQRPDLLIDEMLRVGREAIVTFPNFGHWKTRLDLLFSGKMPVTRALPNQWYDTPNIHLFTIRDFEKFCKQKNLRVIKRSVVDVAHKRTLGTTLLPNLLGEVALYQFKRK